MDKLYDRLLQYSREDYYPMHMPGHKRNKALLSMVNPYEIDITEIPSFDNLHEPVGLLRELSLRASCLFGAKKSYLLVNGSTSGILAGISASVHRGDKVIIARNCHRSVYHAVTLLGLKPVYVYPQSPGEIPVYGGILPEKIEELLIRDPDSRLVVITSPTYEGVVSDVAAIAAIVHRFGALLLVDEAHGAHFGFHEGFPQSAIRKGADIVIQSIHKTLPALTQTAILHSNLENLNSRIEKFLAIYQSSSPSYILMSGIDRCISLLEDSGKDLFAEFYRRLESFYHDLEFMHNIRLLKRDLAGQYGIYDLDPSKITIILKGTSMSGHTLNQLLRESYHIVMEMEAMDYVLGMTSICDTQIGFDRLRDALLKIDQALWRVDMIDKGSGVKEQILPEQILIPSEAMEKRTEYIKLKESGQRICAAFVSLFPPGSPLIIPGEKIDKSLIDTVLKAKGNGLTITGLHGDRQEEIEVVKC